MLVAVDTCTPQVLRSVDLGQHVWRTRKQSEDASNLVAVMAFDDGKGKGLRRPADEAQREHATESDRKQEDEQQLERIDHRPTPVRSEEGRQYQENKTLYEARHDDQQRVSRFLTETEHDDKRPLPARGSLCPMTDQTLCTGEQAPE